MRLLPLNTQQTCTDVALGRVLWPLRWMDDDEEMMTVSSAVAAASIITVRVDSMFCAELSLVVEGVECSGVMTVVQQAEGSWTMTDFD